MQLWSKLEHVQETLQQQAGPATLCFGGSVISQTSKQDSTKSYKQAVLIAVSHVLDGAYADDGVAA